MANKLMIETMLLVGNRNLSIKGGKQPHGQEIRNHWEDEVKGWNDGDI